MEDDKTQTLINRGQHAQRLLEDEIFRAAMTDAKADLIALWERCKDRDVRDRIWHQIGALEQLRTILWRYINDGRISQRQLNELIAAQTLRAS